MKAAFAIDPNDTLHLFYSNTYQMLLPVHYMRKSPGSRFTEVELNTPPEGIRCWLVVTQDGIMYGDYITGNGPQLITNLSGTWEYSQAQLIGNSQTWTLAATVDSFGKVHFVYAEEEFDGTNYYHSLHYARLAVSNAVDENCDGK